MKYKLNKNVMSNDVSRKAFNTLSVKTFGLSFEGWYQNGYWSNSNRPYTLFDKGDAIANVSVNELDVLWNGKKYNYIQLGTVMTDVNYRNKGLSRYIMEEIMSDYKSKCDAMFLFANASVLEFYPKFGFGIEPQYKFSARINGGTQAFRKLNMNKPEDMMLFRRCYEKTNPFSKVQVINNFSLLMFYCISEMKDCIYYSCENDAVILMEKTGDTLICFDIFCDEGYLLMDILSSAAEAGTNRIILKFTPNNCGDFEVEQMDDKDNTLFVLKDKENIFRHEKLLFPEISHT